MAASRPPRPGEELDPGNLRLSGPGSNVDLTWSPVSLGVLFKLDGSKPPPREKGQDSAYYESIMPGSKTISWVVAQLAASEFTPPGASEPLDISTMVTKLFDAMAAAKGASEIPFDVDIGVQQEPAGLARALARAGTLIAGARPDLAGVQTVRLAILQLPPDGKGTSSPTRWKQLAIGAAPVKPPDPPPAPPVRTWGTGPPVSGGAAPAPAGPTVAGPSKVLPAPAPLRDVRRS